MKHFKHIKWAKRIAVLKAICKRKSLYRLYKRTRSQLVHDRCKQQRNVVISLLRSRKEEYFQNLNSSNAKDFWKSIKRLNSNNSTVIPSLNNKAGLLVNSSQGKAELLNEFFFGCFNRRCPPLSVAHSPVYHLPCTELQEFPEEFLCTEDSVADLLINLDPTKSTGVDNISTRMLKACAYGIAPSLTKLFNLSLTSGTFPNEWKTARIVPIPKTDSPSASVSGYRPISILPIVSKVLERHVKELIEVFLADNAPISKHQWGFMHHRSSTSALISVYHDWLSSLDSGMEVCIVFFDVKKAFDSVPHIPLLQKLKDVGLDPHLLKWVQSYLMNKPR